MDAATVKTKVKGIISKITEIDVAEIGDKDHFIDDLELDSLSLMEIGVEVDFTFKLGASEERLQQLTTLDDSVALVMEHLALRPASAEVA